MKKNSEIKTQIATKTLINNQKRNVFFGKISLSYKQWFFIITKIVLETIFLLWLFFTLLFILVQFSSYSSTDNSNYFDKYFTYLKGLISGNFGYSTFFQADVSSFIWTNIYYSFITIFLSLLFSSIIALFLSSFLAIKNLKSKNTISKSLAIIFYSIPAFVIGIIFLLLFPDITYQEGENNISSFLLIIISLFISITIFYTYLLYKSLNQEMGKSYFNFLYLKGLSDKNIFKNHLSYSLIYYYIYYLPHVLTIIIFNTIALEVLYGVPGLSSLFIDGVNNSDEILLISSLFLYGFIFIFVFNLRNLILKFFNPNLRRIK